LDVPLFRYIEIIFVILNVQNLVIGWRHLDN
jgi:hypothetical protein